jgi:hypothetical protein
MKLNKSALFNVCPSIIIPLLDVLQLEMLFAGAFTYWGPEIFFRIILYNGSVFIQKY